jgi:hypothetical protein
MNSQEIYIENFKSSMQIAQRALYAGIIVSVFSYFLVEGYFEGTQHNIPLLNLEVKSKNITVPGLAIIYFYCGMQCLYFLLLAKKSFNNVADEAISKALINYPSSLLANSWWQALLAPILLGVWYTIFMFAGVVSTTISSIILGSIASSPFFFALKYGSRFKEKG